MLCAMLWFMSIDVIFGYAERHNMRYENHGTMVGHLTTTNHNIHNNRQQKKKF